ncbi:hypothetical protein D3C85_1397540 [compost metagenome]
MSLHLRMVRIGVNSLKSSSLAMPGVPQTLVQKLPSGYLSVTLPSSPTGRSIRSIMISRVFGAVASPGASRTSSDPSVFRPEPTAANNASKKLVLPALLAPMITVRSLKSTSTFASERKLCTLALVIAIPLSIP